MKQLTLVSFYGQKRGDLHRLIKDCHNIIAKSEMSRIFRPYHMNQIHGTIIGMEKLIGFEEPYNANIDLKSKPKGLMNFTRFIDTIKQDLPMKFRFGGFKPTYSKFTSLEEKPYIRSFKVRWDMGKVIIIGWPHKNNNFHTAKILKKLRENIEINCNIKHKYDDDNDLFMVIGEITSFSSLNKSDREAFQRISSGIEEEIRKYMLNKPTKLNLTADEVFIAQYTEETLAVGTTTVFSLNHSKLTPGFIRDLYD